MEQQRQDVGLSQTADDPSWQRPANHRQCQQGRDSAQGEKCMGGMMAVGVAQGLTHRLPRPRTTKNVTFSLSLFLTFMPSR